MKDSTLIIVSETGITAILDEETHSGLLSLCKSREVYRASNVEYDNKKGYWYFDTTPIITKWMKDNWKGEGDTILTPDRFGGYATRQEALDAEVRWLERFLKERG